MDTPRGRYACDRMAEQVGYRVRISSASSLITRQHLKAVIANGRGIADIRARHPSAAFVPFMNKIDRNVPKGLDVHVISDNLSAHKSPTVQKWLLRHRPGRRRVGDIRPQLFRRGEGSSPYAVTTTVARRPIPNAIVWCSEPRGWRVRRDMVWERSTASPPCLPKGVLRWRLPLAAGEAAGVRTPRRSHRLAVAERSAFAGYRLPPEVILLAVRWYLRFGLSYGDVEELLAERGVDVDHVTIYRWVQRFTSELMDAARPRRNAVGGPLVRRRDLRPRRRRLARRVPPSTSTIR